MRDEDELRREIARQFPGMSKPDSDEVARRAATQIAAANTKGTPKSVPDAVRDAAFDHARESTPEWSEMAKQHDHPLPTDPVASKQVLERRAAEWKPIQALIDKKLAEWRKRR